MAAISVEEAAIDRECSGQLQYPAGSVGVTLRTAVHKLRSRTLVIVSMPA